MAKSLNAAVTTAYDAQQKKPVLLFELELTGLTLRYAAINTDIVFEHGGATTYTAKAVEFAGLNRSMEGQISRVNVKFDNVARDMAAYVAAYEFQNRMLTIKRIFLDADNHAPSDASYYDEVFHGAFEAPQDIGRRWLAISATAGKPLRQKTLLKTYDKPCIHRFGYGQCNQDGNADLTSLTATGTADSGSTTTLAHSGLTQADDYWNFGRIVIVHDGVTYERIVKDFDAGSDTITFDLALPVAVDNTTTYTVYKGCDKTYATCQAQNAWGPSADNKANFLGFIHIGRDTT